MLKKRLFLPLWVLSGFFIFSAGILISGSTQAQSPESQDVSPDTNSVGAECEEESAISSEECQRPEDVQRYWNEHCRGLLGRYEEQPGIPGVVFKDVHYFRGAGLVTFETSTHEHVFDLPETAASQIFILTEVWCIRKKFQSALLELAEYLLGDIEVYAEEYANIDPSPAVVPYYRLDLAVPSLTFSYREVHGTEELEQKLESGGLYTSLRRDFIPSSEIPIDLDTTIFGHIFPDLEKSQIVDLSDINGMPTQGQELCPVNDGSLQCLIVNCVNENYFKLEYPHYSPLYSLVVPNTYPAPNSQIVGLPMWIESILYTPDLGRPGIPEDNLEEVRKYYYKTGLVPKTLGEFVSDWSGDVEACLDRTGESSLFSDDAPRVGFWSFWENLMPTSENNCPSSVSVSDTLTPVCEEHFGRCLRLPERPGSVQERDGAFTAIFLSCGWGTLYDMGEKSDNTDQLWCGREEEYLPGDFPSKTPPAVRALTEIYAFYLRTCNYTYSRSSLDEPGEVFTVVGLHWRSISCWMADGTTCGTWWFAFPTEFEVTVYEIQALESSG